MRVRAVKEGLSASYDLEGASHYPPEAKLVLVLLVFSHVPSQDALFSKQILPGDPLKLWPSLHLTRKTEAQRRYVLQTS